MQTFKQKHLLLLPLCTVAILSFLALDANEAFAQSNKPVITDVRAIGVDDWQGARITWKAMPNADSYRFETRNSPTSIWLDTFPVAIPTSTTSWDISRLFYTLPTPQVRVGAEINGTVYWSDIRTLVRPQIPDPSATPFDGGVSLIWDPAKPPTRDFEIRYKLSTASSWITYNDGVSPVRSVSIDGLTNGMSYDFRVRAQGDYHGYWSSIVSATPTGYTAPTWAPVISLLHATSDSITYVISHAAGDPDRRSNMGYKVEYWIPGQDKDINFVRDSLGTLSDLEKCTEYNVRAATENQAGYGPSSQTASIVTLKPDPLVLSLTSVTNDTATASWTGSSCFPFEKYIVQYREAGKAWHGNWIDLPGNTTTVQIPNLKNSTDYDIRVIGEFTVPAEKYRPLEGKGNPDVKFRSGWPNNLRVTTLDNTPTQNTPAQNTPVQNTPPPGVPQGDYDKLVQRAQVQQPQVQQPQVQQPQIQSDNTPPIITPPRAITTEATGTNTRVLVSLPTVSDDRTDSDDIVIRTNATGTWRVVTSTVNVSFPLGIHNIGWSATDEAGNTANTVQSVTIRDTTPPVIQQPRDITRQGTLPLAVSYTTPRATDVVDGSVPVTCTPASGSLFTAASTQVTCTAQDSQGNTATPVTFDVIISDTPPEQVRPPRISYWTGGV